VCRKILFAALLEFLEKRRKNSDSCDEHEVLIIHVNIHAISDRENTP
jgi:hypothetical protein